MTKSTNQTRKSNTPAVSLKHALSFQLMRIRTVAEKYIGAPLRKNIFTKTNKPIIVTALLLGLLGSVVFSPAASDTRFFGLIGAYMITAFFYRLSSRLTFTICLALLGIMYLNFLVFGTSAATENAAVWLVLFMAVGIAQQWFENEKK